MTQALSRVAVVGCGHWGENLVRNFARLDCLAAICDSDATRTQHLGKQYNAPAHTLKEILQDDAVHAVAIATPADSHCALTREALRAGKHVFVEKPLALEVAVARELSRLAEAQRRVLMVGHILQYHPAFLRLRELVADGELGRLCHVYSHRCTSGKIRREDNILWGLASHDVSMILSLMDEEPGRVSANGGFFLHSQTADVVTTHLSFPAQETTAHVFVSWLHPCKEQQLVAVGDEGMVIFDDMQPWQQKLLVHRHGRPRENGAPGAPATEGEPVAVSPAEPLRQELEHFLDCIADNASCRTDAAEAIRVLKVLQAAEQDMHGHRACKGNGAPILQTGAGQHHPRPGHHALPGTGMMKEKAE